MKSGFIHNDEFQKNLLTAEQYITKFRLHSLMTFFLNRSSALLMNILPDFGTRFRFFSPAHSFQFNFIAVSVLTLRDAIRQPHNYLP